MACNSAKSKKVYKNIDEILDFVLESNGDSDAEIDLGGSDFSDDYDYDSEWENEPEPLIISNPVAVLTRENIDPVPVVEEPTSSASNKKLAFRLMMQMTLNVHKVFQKTTGSTMTFQEFVHDVIVNLVTARPYVPVRECVPDDTFQRLTGRHFASVKTAPPDVKNQRPCKRCRVCYARGIRTKAGRDVKTVYICKDCPSEPGLHPGLCFEVYHTKIDYVTVE